MSIIVLATLKKATSVPETCRWLPYNKPTFIHSSGFAGILKKLCVGTVILMTGATNKFIT